MQTCETFPEKINRINGIYYISIYVGVLNNAKNELKEMLANTGINAENNKNALGLYCRISIKTIALDYVNSDYSFKAYEKLNKEINILLETHLGKEDFPKTVELANNIDSEAKVLNEFMAEVMLAKDDAFDAIHSNELNFDYAKVINVFSDKIKEIDKICEWSIHFNKVAFPAVKDLVKKELNSFIKELNNFVIKVNESRYGESYHSFLEKKEGYNKYKYFPVLFDNKDSAPIRFVCSTFQDEVELLVYSYGRHNNKTITSVNVSSLYERFNSDDGLNYFFNKLKSESSNLAFYGLALCKEKEIRAMILSKIASIASQEKIAIIHDTTGNRMLYYEYESLAKKAKLQKYPDSFYRYLTVPDYPDVQRIFEELNMLPTLEDINFVKQNGAFMGYIGLNKAIISYVSNKTSTWKQIIKDASAINLERAQEYVKNIPSPSQIIDSCWDCDLKVKYSVEHDRKSFDYDYDATKAYNKKNLQLILEDPYANFYEKCGMVVRYCLLNGNDAFSWKSLEKEEIKKRLDRATKILARILNTELEPEVEIAEELLSGKAGGLCCDGGKKIMYEINSAKSFEWVFDAVLHETFHSLQHTALNCGWKDWYFNELQITKCRIAEWKRNSQSYSNIDGDFNSYMNQIYEADTRIFAREATEGASRKWSTINLI